MLAIARNKRRQGGWHEASGDFQMIEIGAVTISKIALVFAAAGLRRGGPQASQQQVRPQLAYPSRHSSHSHEERSTGHRSPIGGGSRNGQRIERHLARIGINGEPAVAS
jgi:hypothetical protein